MKARSCVYTSGGSHRVCVVTYDCENVYHTIFHAFKQLNMKTQLHFHMTLSHPQWKIAHFRTHCMGRLGACMGSGWFQFRMRHETSRRGLPAKVFKKNP